MTTKLISSESGCRGVDMPDGSKINRSRDGAFHVDDPRTVRALRKDGFFLAGTGFANAPKSWWCPKCAHEKVFKHCGTHPELGELSPTNPKAE